MFEIMNKEKNIIVEPQGESLGEFLRDFEEKYPQLLSSNVVVNLNNIILDTSSDVMKLYDYARRHMQNNTSFVVVTQMADVDLLPEDFNVVPTLVEAMDILEMDEIGRDLGF